MKMRATLVLVGLGAATVVGCAARSPDHDLTPIDPCFRSSISSHSTVMGKRLIWMVCESDLDDSALWPEPKNTEPPLTVQRAVQISEGELPQYFPDVEIWDLEDIELHSFANGTKWFYVVSWRARGTRGDDLGIPMLMNGHPVRLTPE